MIPNDKSDTRANGLIEAQHIVAAVAESLPKVRWWQLGRKRCHQMVALSEVSERICSEIIRIHDARFAALMPSGRSQDNAGKP